MEHDFIANGVEAFADIIGWFFAQEYRNSSARRRKVEIFDPVYLGSSTRVTFLLFICYTYTM